MAEKQTVTDWLRDRIGYRARVALAFATLPFNKIIAPAETIAAPQAIVAKEEPPAAVLQQSVAQIGMPSLDSIPGLAEVKRDFQDLHLPVQILDTVSSVGTLHDSMPGIYTDVHKQKIITYTFEKTAKMDSLQTPKKQKEGYGVYRLLTEEEKVLARQAMEQWEGAGRIKFVEVSGSEARDTVYLTFGAFDLSQVPFTYEGRSVKMAGQALFPNSDRSYVILESALPQKQIMPTFLHEIGHVLGAEHNQAVTQVETQMSYHLHQDWAVAKLFESPSTLQPADLEYARVHYGDPLPRAPQIHIIGQDQFVGTLVVLPGDKLLINKAPSGFLNLNVGVEHGSIMNGTRFGLTGHLQNVTIESSQETMLLGKDSTHLAINNDFLPTTIITQANAEIEMGKGADQVLMVNPHSVTHLYHFQPNLDELLYASNITHHKIVESKGEVPGSEVLLYQGEVPAGKIILYYVFLEELEHAQIRPMKEKEAEAIVNNYRPAVFIEKGNNGTLAGFKPFFHTIQLNTPENIWLESHVSTQDGMTNVILIDEQGRDYAAFSVQNTISPSGLSLYCNKKKIKCVEGESRESGMHTKWTHRGQVIDAHEYLMASLPIVIEDKTAIVLGENFYTLQLKGTAGVRIESPNKAQYMLNVGEGAARISMKHFNVKTDKILCNADSVSVVELGSGVVGVVLHGAQDSYCIIDNFHGNPQTIRVKRIDMPNQTVSINKIKPSEISDAMAADFKTCRDVGEVAGYNIDEIFPSLTQQINNNKIKLQPSPFRTPRTGRQ